TAGQGCAGCAALSTVPGANALPVDFYRPYLGFGDISFVEWAAYSRYNSLQTSFNRRFRNGISVLVNYTLGKAMGTSSADLPIMTNVNAIGAQRNDENNRKTPESCQSWSTESARTPSFVFGNCHTKFDTSVCRRSMLSGA